jgi:hypothetical protein
MPLKYVQKLYNKSQVEKKQLSVVVATAGFIFLINMASLSPLDRGPVRLYLLPRDPLVNNMHYSTPVVVLVPQEPYTR